MELVQNVRDLSLRHWRLEPRSGQLVAAVLDRAGEDQNSLSAEVIEELDRLLDCCSADPPRGLLIESAKPGGFIAGADVREFTRIESEEQALAQIRRAHAVFDRLEDMPVPTVAVIRGYCLGGGLELALACRYRVAADDPATRLGFPEVLLGIHPGFGGTVRALEVAGPIKAMDLMLTGRNAYPGQLRRFGLADRVVPPRHLLRAAIHLAETDPGRHQLSLTDRVLSLAPARKLLAKLMRDKARKRADPRHYPAPHALIDLWERHGGDRGRMLSEEAVSVARLIVSDTARNLVRVFFLQEKLKSLGKPASASTSFRADRVHVIGAGVMGGDIAAWCAAQGLTVTIQDSDPEAIGRVIARAGELFKRRLREPRLVRAAFDRLAPDPGGHGVAHADVVIEAIFEDAEAKQSLFREIEPVLRKDALLATNTSSIPLEILGSALARPSRLVGLHFFNPVAKMQLVEIVIGAETSRLEAGRASVFTRQIARLPVPVKSSPGFLVNRVLMPYLSEALELVGEGVPLAAIDRQAMDFGMPVGPVELADTVGLDICLNVAENLGTSFGGRVPEVLARKVRDGDLGRKSGRGFYAWAKGKPQKPAIGKDYQPPEDIGDRMILRYLNEVVTCIREDVVRDHDLVDAGLVFGTGFAPFRGGPMHHIRAEGVDKLKEKLKSLAGRYGERFSPDAGWDEIARPDQPPGTIDGDNGYS